MFNTQSFFEYIFKNAIENSILIMDTKGIILNVNKGFLQSFGYIKKDLVNKNFNFLFTAHDRAEQKPEKEIKITLSKKSKSDNNYLLHKDGTPIWVLGESVLVTNDADEKYIVKIIQNINTQKKLEGFLIDSNEFINTIFDSIKDAAFVILNSELRILRCNKMFYKIFELPKTDLANIKLSQVENAFWKQTELKKQIANIIVTKKEMKAIHFKYINKKGKEIALSISSKLMENEGMGRTILLVIKKGVQQLKA